MSSAVFPTLVGMTMDRDREPQWSTIVQQSVSGKETRVALRNYPRSTWKVNFDILRSGAAFGELQLLYGFFNLRSGMWDSFLFDDNDDNTAVAQGLGIGNGTTTAFQLNRSYGGFDELIQAPNVVTAVYLDGVLQSPAVYTVTMWGANIGGQVVFNSAPGSSVVVTADFTYYWPVRFTDDKMTFNRFMSQMYDAKSVGFIQIL